MTSATSSAKKPTATGSSTSSKSEPGTERRGSVLEMLQSLLTERRDDDVVALVSQLVSRNRDLELLLAKLRQGRNQSEHVSKEQLDLFLQKLGGQASEDLAKANAQLEDAAKQNGGRPEPEKPAKQPPVRRAPSPDLRRVPNPIAVPESERPCPRCGIDRKCIAHEKTEVIELIPAEVIVREDIREVLGCERCDAELVRAPMGDKVVTGGAYGSRLVADLVVGKYWDSLPLHRQKQILQRLGLDMPSSSMADQILWATELLRPVYRFLIKAVLDSHVLHVDGTSLPVRDADSPKGIVLGALWGYVGDEEHAVYLYTSTAKKTGQRPDELGPEQFLALRRGLVVADASNLFDASFHRDELIECGCAMHARRYFVKALEANDARAAVPLAAFKALYDIEAAVQDATSEQRFEERQSRSKPVFDELISWCRTYHPIEPPSSLLAKAMQYVLNQREPLARFLEDGRIPIDNGVVERLHRRPAVGRRNYLFAGSHEGAHRAAVAYSVLATCALVGVNPIEYLADILPRLARGTFTAVELSAMTPSAWKKARGASSPPA